jgi:uncharacterized protein DUF1236
MTKARLLSTVAAALLLSAGIASAQDVKKDEAPGHAPAAQQKAPPEKIAPNMKAGKADAITHKPAATVGQAPQAPEADKAHASDDKARASDDKASASDKSAMEPNAKSNATSHESATTGQGAGASAKLSTEQRSKIGSILREHKVEPAHLNVSVNIGTRIPDSVHFYPLPEDVYAIYPEWRGYDYILVGDEILVVDPRTHEIVAILEA